jgi:hypothetical protein
VIGKPTSPLDRPICGAVARVGLGLAEITRANLRKMCGDYIALVGLPIARCCAIIPIAPFLG